MVGVSVGGETVHKAGAVVGGGSDALNKFCATTPAPIKVVMTMYGIDFFINFILT